MMRERLRPSALASATTTMLVSSDSFTGLHGGAMGRFMPIVCAYSWCWTRSLTCVASKLVAEWRKCTDYGTIAVILPKSAKPLPSGCSTRISPSSGNARVSAVMLT